MNRLICIAFLCVALGLACTGCNRSTPTEDQAPANTILIKPWIVLEQFDTLGGQGNCGCRLTQAELDAVYASLEDNDSSFAPGLQIDVLQQSVIFRPQAPCGRGNPNLLENGHLIIITNFILGSPIRHARNAINIYFTGNYGDGREQQGLPSPQRLYGATIDPAAVHAMPGDIDDYSRLDYVQ